MKRVLIIMMCLFVISGCGNHSTNQNQSKGDSTTTKTIPSSTSIQNLTKKTIKQHYNKVNNIQFEDYNNMDNVGYLLFHFNTSKKEYYGFTLSYQTKNQWELSNFESIPVSKNEPVNVYQFVGTLPGNIKQKVHVLSGYVNNNDIRQVYLYYPSNVLKVIILNKTQHGFLDIDVGSDQSLNKIVCKSSENKIIYQKEYNVKK